MATDRTDRFDGYDMDALSGRDDPPESRTVASRARLRRQIDSDLEAYLREGGKIHSAEPGVLAEPRDKPENEYNSRPI